MGSRINLAIKNPQLVLDWFKRNYLKFDERALVRLTSSSLDSIISYQKEFEESNLRNSLFDGNSKTLEYVNQGIISSNPNLNIKIAGLYYALIRSTKPDIVIETGVASGISSAVILSALECNGKGKLFSIDLPNSSTSESDVNVPYVPPEKDVGWIIPESLKKPWTLILGDAKKELQPLLEKKKKVDVFIHDSLHTYDHMMWECQTAWPFLKPGGFLIVDDAYWNDAFKDFRKDIEKSNQGKGYKSQIFAFIKKR